MNVVIAGYQIIRLVEFGSASLAVRPLKIEMGAIIIGDFIPIHEDVISRAGDPNLAVIVYVVGKNLRAGTQAYCHCVIQPDFAILNDPTHPRNNRAILRR